MWGLLSHVANAGFHVDAGKATAGPSWHVLNEASEGSLLKEQQQPSKEAGSGMAGNKGTLVSADSVTHAQPGSARLTLPLLGATASQTAAAAAACPFPRQDLSPGVAVLLAGGGIPAGAGAGGDPEEQAEGRGRGHRGGGRDWSAGAAQAHGRGPPPTRLSSNLLAQPREAGEHPAQAGRRPKDKPWGKEGEAAGADGPRLGRGGAAARSRIREDNAAGDPLQGLASSCRAGAGEGPPNAPGAAAAGDAGRQGEGCVEGRDDEVEEYRQEGDASGGEGGSEEASRQQALDATSSMPSGSARASGVEAGMFSSVGVKGRRTRPNRMSGRHALTTEYAAVGMSKGAREAGVGRRRAAPSKADKAEATKADRAEASPSLGPARDASAAHADDAPSPPQGDECGSQGEPAKAGSPKFVLSGQDKGQDGEDDSALGSRVKEGGKERREKAKRKCSDSDGIFWDWPPAPADAALGWGAPHPPPKRTAPPESSAKRSGPPEGNARASSVGSDKPRLKRARGTHGSQELKEEVVDEHGDGEVEAGLGDQERPPAQGGASAAEDGAKPKGRGRGRPRKTPPIPDEVAARGRVAGQSAPTPEDPALLGKGEGVVEKVLGDVQTPSFLHCGRERQAFQCLPNSSPTPSPPPPVPLHIEAATCHGLRQQSRSPPPPALVSERAAGVPPPSSMVTRQRDGGVAPKVLSRELSASGRPIRSKRVQERAARAEGDRERPMKGQKPLYISLTLSKEEISQDFHAIMGHRRLHRPRRSQIAALGLQLCSHLSQPHWHSY